MNLSRCEKGHFYDKEKFQTCPHCAGGGASDESLTTVFTEDVTEPMDTPPFPPIQPVPSVTPGVVPSPQGDFPPIPPTPPFPVAGFSADQPTVGMFNGDQSVTIPVTETGGMDDDDGHTIGFFDEDFFQPTDMTEMKIPGAGNGAAARPVNKVSTPCVGWLISLGGAHIGTDFRLKAGKNFIGRGANMDIALTEDKSVSRDKHAIVVYEPKEHLYLIQPGEASTLVYRNNEVVLSPMKLEAYDVITVGDINLLFMPLCNKNFNWSDLLEEMKNK